MSEIYYGGDEKISKFWNENFIYYWKLRRGRSEEGLIRIIKSLSGKRFMWDKEDMCVHILWDFLMGGVGGILGQQVLDARSSRIRGKVGKSEKKFWRVL